MESFETDELTDRELSEMLAAWMVPVPSEDLRARVFSRAGSMTRRSGPELFRGFTDVGRLEVPWYRSLARGVKEVISPPKLAPFEVTSKPVEVSIVWEANAGRQARSGVLSVTAHAAVVLLALLSFGSPAIRKKVRDISPVYLVNAYKPKLPASAEKAGGGGGGGRREPTPVTKGAAPKMAPKQFIPPAVAVAKPLLPVVPAITAPAPVIVAENYGDPLSTLVGTSAGQGVNGLGSGRGGGLGSGNGDGFGAGHGGGSGGGAYRIGVDVSSPILISKVEPEYSDEARKAKYSGKVLLSVVVNERGIPTEIRVIQPLGLGLDEKAIEAVQRWRFRPGFRNGQPVAVLATVEVNFRLL